MTTMCVMQQVSAVMQSLFFRALWDRREGRTVLKLIETDVSVMTTLSYA